MNLKLLKPGLMLTALMLGISLLNAQTIAKKAYFQQKLAYQINCSLDDVNHILRAEESIEYTNQSPDGLKEIYFHVWMNAFRNKHTPYARQKIAQNSNEFLRAKKKRLGGTDSLNFQVNGTAVHWEYVDASHEIVKISLAEELKPGQSIKISTPFRIKFPKIFSRGGHDGQAYQVTQWYPKPAVYDAQGWHTFPYLDQGEFYAEFASYDVSITLPENYTVGATGILQTLSERVRLKRLADSTTKYIDKSDFPIVETEFPASSKQLKTLRYVQDSVHDYAWFADKRYLVAMRSIKITGRDKPVELMTLYNPAFASTWYRAIEDVATAVRYYSESIGTYPYGQVTAVTGSLLESAGGMEYPMVTVISKKNDIEETILHEIGHNWFQGILASNERDHPWMDESFNSYYDNHFYEKGKQGGSYVKDGAREYDILSSSEELSQFANVVLARTGEDQASGMTSPSYSELQYQSNFYGRIPAAIQYLRLYLGSVVFENCIRGYYQEWKFRHPQPEDMKASFEKISGKDLSWFFDGFINTDRRIDYSISNIDESGDQTRMKIKNNGNLEIPVMAAGIRGDSTSFFQFIPNIKTDTTITVPRNNVYILNPYVLIPDINSINSRWDSKYKGKKPITIRGYFGTEDFKKTNIFIAPLIGYNCLDGFTPGIGVYNDFVPAKRFNYLFLPQYGIDTRQLVGMSHLAYNFYPYQEDRMHHVEIGMYDRRYSAEGFTGDAYNRFAGYVCYEYKNKRKPYSALNSFKLEVLDITHTASRVGEFLSLRTGLPDNFQVYNAIYSNAKGNSIKAYELKLKYQLTDNFSIIQGSLTGKIPSVIRRQMLYGRLFAGTFLKNTNVWNRAYMPLSGTNGYYDYSYDNIYFDRSGGNNFVGNQIELDRGGMKAQVNNAFSTKKFLFSGNFSASIPYLPIHLFFDVGFMPDATTSTISTFYTGGLSLIVRKDVFEIYFPMIYSKNVNDQVQRAAPDYRSQISFLFNFKYFSPYRISKQLDKIL